MLSPIIIIGAPRSGTNMLRDLLCRLDTANTWPCDEINYIWKHGNRTYPNDQFPPSFATPAVQSYIQAQFNKQQKRIGDARLVEKTCANALRVEFVNEVFPDAQFIHIVRNGEDAAVSALDKSKASIDLSYLWSKVRFVPLSDIPYYGLRYLYNRISRFFTKTKVMRNWGPVPQSKLLIDENPTPLQLSAHQWSECVSLASEQLNTLGEHRYITVQYEDLVANPENEFIKILQYLDLTIPSNLNEVLSIVRRDSIGKGRKKLEHHQKESIRPILQPACNLFGYSLD